MSGSITDMFRAETEFEVRASEMYAVMREATKAEFMLNGAKCDVPARYVRQIVTGKREAEPEAPLVVLEQTESAAGQQDKPETAICAADDLNHNKEGDGLAIVRKTRQGAEWKDIRQIIQSGRAPVSIPQGTEIEFDLKDGRRAVVAVVNTDHYSTNDAVFMFRRILGKHRMNADRMNEGGWRDSELRGYMNKDIFALLPDELQEVIAEHETVQVIDGDKYTAKDKLFLPSETEMQGFADFSEHNGVDGQFPYFKERINRIVKDDDGDPCLYWLADPSCAYTTAFCLFTYYGGSINSSATNSLGVAPLFVIE